MKPPKPFRLNGEWWEPVAVAMYGELREVVPLGDVLDESGEMYEGHTILWSRIPWAEHVAATGRAPK